MTIQMPTLPYAVDALEPTISRAAIDNHLNNHHKRYVSRVNDLVAGTPMSGATLEEIIKSTARRKTTSELFNNAAQAWNHEFFWRSMKPSGGGLPTGAIATQIDTDFRGYDDFAVRFKKAALTVFGSGWVWLVLDANKLKIVTTKDAGTPSTRGLIPILTLDLWEHAYYPDYQSRRGDYVDKFLTTLLNWEFANENLLRADVQPLAVRSHVLHRIDRHMGIPAKTKEPIEPVAGSHAETFEGDKPPSNRPATVVAA